MHACIEPLRTRSLTVLTRVLQLRLERANRVTRKLRDMGCQVTGTDLSQQEPLLYLEPTQAQQCFGSHPKTRQRHSALGWTNTLDLDGCRLEWPQPTRH